MTQDKTIYIFTDGACRGNPGPGGWGALLRYQGHEKKLKGAEPYTTNNRMELLAVIQALAALKTASEVAVTTDSQYVKRGITEWLPQWKRNNWKNSQKQPVKNADLWQQLDEAAKQHRIAWYWVRGHSGHIENEIADNLANQAIDLFIRNRG
jgi:ribonuclease HI